MSPSPPESEFFRVHPRLKSPSSRPFAPFAVNLLLLVASAIAPAQDQSADLPIHRVVMFSSGVAYFEHSGTVEGDANVEMKFDVKDINDLLKSMVLQDEGGGRISTVSYGSKDPLTRTLATFSIDLTQNPTLADLLNQIRGEQIELDAPTKITGTILGVEKRQVPAGKDGATVEAAFLTLLTDDGLRSVALDGVGRIKLKNDKLDKELRQALLILATSKSNDKKAVSLSFLGQGKRPVRVGYIQEAPIWKTSYRLVLSDKDKPFLQGWAIVENTTESDWTDVGLTLVSGRPISFTMDLYQPLYVDRPEVKPELYASLRPRTYDQDLEKAYAEFRAASGEQLTREQLQSQMARRGEPQFASPARAAAPAAPRPGMAGGGGFGGQRGAMAGGFGGEGAGRNLSLAMQQTQSMAQASNVGELFRYQIATPVKLARGKSAMLPIVNESVQGEKVSIYNEQTQPKHPLNGLKLKNSTDLHLMQGPITVFDDDAYAGDAQIQDLPPGSERLISYALDLDTEVAPTIKQQPSSLISVTINKGTLITSYKHARTKSFTVKNSGKKTKQVLVEYPIEQPWTLVDPKQPAEKTRAQYRFLVTADPGKPARLDVSEEHTQRESIALTNLDDNRIGIFTSAREVSDALKNALRDIVKRKTAIQQSTQKRQELERQITVIEAEQKRIRENMAELPKDSDLFRRYVTKFTEQEDQIDSLRKQTTATIEEENRLKKSLDEYLANLNLS
ncbi:MAG TPA: hypothetical protein VGI40_00675 [Pirellulaceae bacterium]|jgi:hypothetical protein